MKSKETIIIGNNTTLVQYEKNGILHAEFANNNEQMIEDNNVPQVAPFELDSQTNIVTLFGNPSKNQGVALNNVKNRSESYGFSSKNRTFANEGGAGFSESNPDREFPYVPTKREELEERRKLLSNAKCRVLRQVEILQVFFSELFDKFPYIRSLNYIVNNANRSLQIISRSISTAYEIDKKEKRAKIRHLKRANIEIGVLVNTMTVIYDIAQRDFHKNLISQKQMRHIIGETADIKSKITSWIATLEKAVQPQKL